MLNANSCPVFFVRWHEIKKNPLSPQDLTSPLFFVLFFGIFYNIRERVAHFWAQNFLKESAGRDLFEQIRKSTLRTKYDESLHLDLFCSLCSWISLSSVFDHSFFLAGSFLSFSDTSRIAGTKVWHFVRGTLLGENIARSGSFSVHQHVWPCHVQTYFAWLIEFVPLLFDICWRHTHHCSTVAFGWSTSSIYSLQKVQTS